MFNKPHPARGLRTATGAVGTSSFVVMVIAIAADAAPNVEVDVLADVGSAGAAQPAAVGASLQLSGGATPLPGQLVDVQSETQQAADVAAPAVSIEQPAPSPDTTQTTVAQEPTDTSEAVPSTVTTAPATTASTATTAPPASQVASSQPASTSTTPTTAAPTSASPAPTTAAPTSATVAPTTEAPTPEPSTPTGPS